MSGQTRPHFRELPACSPRLPCGSFTKPPLYETATLRAATHRISEIVLAIRFLGCYSFPAVDRPLRLLHFSPRSPGSRPSSRPEDRIMRNSQHRCALRCEHLEGRDCPAIFVLGGYVAVLGTAGADTVD